MDELIESVKNLTEQLTELAAALREYSGESIPDAESTGK